MELLTTRLILKPHTMNNLAKIHLWVDDPDLLFYNDDDHEPYPSHSFEEIELLMSRFINATPEANKDIIHFAIHKRDNDELIGYCMIAFIDKYHKRCKFGITIGEFNEWGKGYGKEVTKEITRYCFEDLNMNRIGVEIYSHNSRSIRLFEDVGFVQEGVIRESVLKQGKYIDEYIYGIIKSDWRKRI